MRIPGPDKEPGDFFVKPDGRKEIYKAGVICGQIHIFNHRHLIMQ